MQRDTRFILVQAMDALRPVRECSCIPCTGVLVVGGYKLSERGSSSQVSAERNAGYRVRHIARVNVREPT